MISNRCYHMLAALLFTFATAQSARADNLLRGQESLLSESCIVSFDESETTGYCEAYNFQTRGTLLQWSCGTSFSGGPDLQEPLVTDRPDFTEASVTVGCGVAQLECGYTYYYDNEAGQTERTHSLGEPLLRVGLLAEWLEFRIAAGPLDQRNRDALGTIDTSGLSDMYLGLKIALTPQECWLPEMAIIPQMNIPTGANGLTSGHIESGVNWIYSWEINEHVSTAGSSQANRRIDETGNAYLEIAQSWTIAYCLTENLGAYTEWFALIPSGADTARTEHYFNGGFTFLLNGNVQWDIRSGLGLHRPAGDYFVGTGLSVRFGASQDCN